MKHTFAVKLLTVLSILLLAGVVSAHSDTYGIPNPIEVVSWDIETLDHDDQDPWKGWATVIVMNTMVQDWTDFHFSLNDPSGTVIFRENDQPGDPAGQIGMLDGVGGPETTPLRSGYTYEIAADGRSVDFYFDSNPVVNNDVVTFNVYTDNTANQEAWFGICYQPTPEPTTIGLLAMGALMIRRKRS